MSCLEEAKERFSHYDWMRLHLDSFWQKATGVVLDEREHRGMVIAHGDKCYQYEGFWEKAGVPFPQGVAIYLLSYVTPFSKEVRETEEGWVSPATWVVDNYERFKHCFPEES